MALLITPTGPYLHTAHGFEVPAVYAKIGFIGYDPITGMGYCDIIYFVSREASKLTPPRQPFELADLPNRIEFLRPLDILLNAGEGANAYAEAYIQTAEALRLRLGNLATVTDDL